MSRHANDSEKQRAAERLFKALSGVDESYLKECEAGAAPARKSRSVQFLVRYAAAVLCLAVLGAGYYAVQRAGADNRSAATAEVTEEIAEEIKPDSSITASGSIQSEAAATDGQQDGSAAAKAEENTTTTEGAETELLEMPEASECDLTGASQETADKESTQENQTEGTGDTTDEHKDDIVTSVGEAQGNGNTTEDIPADESAYEDAHAYSEEVEEIQAAISQAMADGELPFVTSSAIHENPVRITVTVNTTDQALIDQVMAYDTSGENLVEIVYSGTVINGQE